MVIPFFFFDLSLHLFVLLPLDGHVVLLNLADYLLPQFLLLEDILLVELDYGGLIDIGGLHLVHRELIVDVLQLQCFVPGWRVLEDEDEEAASAEDDAIEMEDLLLSLADGVTVDEGIIARVLVQQFDVALLRIRIVRNKGMVGLDPQRSQYHIRLGVPLLVADVQLLAGVFDPEA